MLLQADDLETVFLGRTSRPVQSRYIYPELALRPARDHVAMMACADALVHPERYLPPQAQAAERLKLTQGVQVNEDFFLGHRSKFLFAHVATGKTDLFRPEPGAKRNLDLARTHRFDPESGAANDLQYPRVGIGLAGVTEVRPGKRPVQFFRPEEDDGLIVGINGSAEFPG